MPAEFQQAIDCTLVGLSNTFCFLDDILIVSRGRIENHLDLVRKCLIKLDQENLRINLAKCHLAKDQIEWLGHRRPCRNLLMYTHGKSDFKGCNPQGISRLHTKRQRGQVPSDQNLHT